MGFLKVLKGSAYDGNVQMNMALSYKNREPYEVLSTKWLDYGHVLKLKNVENMVEVYYNSGQFARKSLEYAESFFPDSVFYL